MKEKAPKIKFLEDTEQALSRLPFSPTVQHEILKLIERAYDLGRAQGRADQLSPVDGQDTIEAKP